MADASTILVAFTKVKVTRKFTVEILSVPALVIFIEAIALFSYQLLI